ncbi:uncharacterized protein METZ01_LOCUS467363, partial [marine metagenome]
LISNTLLLSLQMVKKSTVIRITRSRTS